MTYRGLRLAFACIAIGFAAVYYLPGRYARYAVMFFILGGWVGGAIHFRDWYRDLKQFERDRDEFNRKLRDR